MPVMHQHDSMSYFAAKAIRDKLAGSADKTLFGGLKGSAGSWDKIVKAYEKQSKPSTTVISATYNRLSMLNSRFSPSDVADSSSSNNRARQCKIRVSVCKLCLSYCNGLFQGSSIHPLRIVCHVFKLSGLQLVTMQ
ncbi:hypothetical protein ABBQ32_007603 [Trebouxia sp. C0010 RCD-2024]